MEQKDIIRKIKEYHVIRDMLKDNAVQAAAKNPKYAEIVAVFKSFAEFFGGMRIDQFEDFDRMFRRLENIYIAGNPDKKVQPTEVGYVQYIRSVLGKKGLETVTAVANEEYNLKRIKDFTLDVGRAQESNILVVSDALLKGAKYSNILGLYHESVAAGQRKDEKLAELRNRAGIAAKVAHTEEAVLAEIAKLEQAMFDKMAAYSTGNEDLMKAIAKSTGRKLNQILNSVDEAKTDIKETVGEVRTDIKETVRKTGDRVLDAIGATRNDMNARFDATSNDIANLDKKIGKQGKSLNGWKGAGLVAAGAASLAAVNLILAGLGVFPTAVPENTSNANNGDISKYVQYIDDSQELNSQLYSLINDGKLTEAEKNGFVGTADTTNAPVQTFLNKYSETELKDKSVAYANSITTIANGIYGMTGAQDLLSGYNTDVAALSTALNGILADGVTADEKTTFIDGNVAKFLNKYATTELKEASEAQADGFEMIVENYYSISSENGQLSGSNGSLAAANELLTAYNGDVAALNVALGDILESDAMITEDEKNAFVNTDIAEFLAEYETTSLKEASEAQADGFKKVLDNAYGYSVAQTLLSEYNSDVAALDTKLYDYLTDAIYTADEKAEYDAAVDAFANKYAKTSLAEICGNDAATMKNISTNISTMSEDKQQALANLAKVNGEYAVLEQEVAALTQNNADLLSANAELSAQVDSLTSEMAGLKTEIAELKELLAQADDSKEQELLVKIGKLESDLEKAKADYAALEEKFNTLETENAGLVEQIKTLTEENDSLKAELAEANTMIEEIEDEKAELLSELTAKNITIEEYATQIAELEASEDSLKTTIASLESQIADKDAQIADLTSQVTEKDALVEYYKSEVETLTAENAELSAELAEANNLISSANEIIAALQAEKTALEEDLKNNYITKAEYNAKVAELEAVEQGLKDQIAELTNNIGSIQAELDAKKQEYNKLLEKYQALETKDAETEQALTAAKNEIIALEEQLSKASVEATTLVFDIYEYITGSTTTDINTAMKVIAEQLGITTVPPSSEAGSNVKQPGM